MQKQSAIFCFFYLYSIFLYRSLYHSSNFIKKTEHQTEPLEEKKKKPTENQRVPFLRSGENRIRTCEALLTLTRFPGVPLQPLEHLSLLKNGLTKTEQKARFCMPFFDNRVQSYKKIANCVHNSPFFLIVLQIFFSHTEPQSARSQAQSDIFSSIMEAT